MLSALKGHPLITIGLTHYNASDTFKRALESALAQTWPHKEIIIVDDGSEPKALHHLKDLIGGHDEVRLIIHKENKGFPAALNTITENAKGDFIALMDDDDRSHPDRLEKQYQRLIAYEQKTKQSFVFCYSNRHIYNHEQDQSPAYDLYAIGRTPPEPQGLDVSDFLLWSTGSKGYSWGLFGSCTLMVRRQSLVKLGGFDSQFRRCAEWDLAIRAGFQGAHFIAVDEPLIDQFKTYSDDKKAFIPLKYSMMLRKKHKNYLRQCGLGYYTGAQCLAKARFYGSKNRMILSVLYRMMNFFFTLLPQRKNYVTARH